MQMCCCALAVFFSYSGTPVPKFLVSKTAANTAIRKMFTSTVPHFT